MFGVLRRGKKHLETIYLPGQFRGDGTDRRVAPRCDVSGGARGIGVHDRCQAERAKPFAALGESLSVAVNLDKTVQCRPDRCQQVVIDALEMFAIDEQAGFGKKMVDIGHTTGNRILYRHHRQCGAAFLNREDHVFERSAGKNLHFGLHGLAGHMRIGAQNTLKGDDVAAVAHECGLP